ncbi:4Fe-4S dicluster domain-containing protein [Microbulbifer yueqingensis]|uniref:4Fe-4S dicluster containing protein n=1 Tax=Microbulbifer yueqingensis TaxID=658219 RepID=A0A1G8ZVZ2_9GAMM|nr:4Fe-4S dicluster domain-containing protein [Microbulbifer yueqingensis]SDK18290.1 4Fe-4S dicluster containing protein [Microbulbifer yueqingensis]
MQSFILEACHLDQLIQAIRQHGFQLVGPRLQDGAILYCEITAADQLPRGWTDEQEKGRYRVRRREDDAFFGYNAGPHSWKKFLQQPRRPVWRAQKAAHAMQIEAVVEDAPAMAFLGVRSCELHAIAIQDRVFVDNRFRNESYAGRREKLFIAAVECATAAPTCFCTSMNTGPEVSLPADLVMTEVIHDTEHYFLIRAGSARGEDILHQIPVEAATARQLRQAAAAVERVRQQVEAGPRSFDSSDLKALLYRNFESPAWDQVAERCLSCANCTMACPTCFCSTVEDTTDLSGDHAERWERWDSCFTADFSHLTGGPVRADTRSRYRQWITHKLATWHDQFGTSGCVGCGRCIAWCPVGIDITEEVERVRRLEG